MNLDNLPLNDLCQLKNRSLSGISVEKLPILILQCRMFLSDQSSGLTEKEKKDLQESIECCDKQIEVIGQRLKNK